MVDLHPPVPQSGPGGAVFDPSTLARSTNAQMQHQHQQQQQQNQARQRYWSGSAAGRPASLAPALDAGLLFHQHSGKQHSGKNPGKQPALQQQWTTPQEKEIYTPFKTASGRNTPLDDPFGVASRNEYTAPQDPRDRAPSRATSVRSASGNIYGRKSDGSVVYQPLTPTNHASAWSNSLMFNKPFPDYGAVPLLDAQPPEMLMGPPPPPHMQTLPRHLPPNQTLMRNTANTGVHGQHGHHGNGNGNGFSTPDEPTHARQQVPQTPSSAAMNGYISTGGASEAYQYQKSADKGTANRVTLIPNGTVINTQSSYSSSEHNENAEQSEKKKSRRLATQRRRREKKAPEKSNDAHVINMPVVEKLAILHILLGACLFALGIARLLLLSIWGLGIELVYGVFVVLTGTLGVIGCRRRHFCSLTACFVMSILSCLLGIAPFVTGLLVTIPDSFRTVDAKLFTSPQEPYGVDILLSVICLLELIVAIVTAALGCSGVGRAVAKWSPATEQYPNAHGAANTKSGDPFQQQQQQPVFHTSVNITHPAMMK